MLDYGGYGMGYMPQQTQPQQQMPQQAQLVGRWLYANDYKQIEAAPVPIDGTPSLFMLANQPIFYVVSMVNGQKYINQYEFKELINTPQTPQASQETVGEPQPTLVLPDSLEARLAQIEQELQMLRKAGSGNDESNISAHESTASTGNTKASGNSGRKK